MKGYDTIRLLLGVISDFEYHFSGTFIFLKLAYTEASWKMFFGIKSVFKLLKHKKRLLWVLMNASDGLWFAFSSALVGTWTRDLSLTKGVLYRWATRALLKWAGLDLNQRRQSQRIYSPPPLTTRAPTPTIWTYQLMDTLCEIILVFLFFSR